MREKRVKKQMAFSELEIDWLKEVIYPAIDSFYNNPEDIKLLKRNLNERNIVAHIFCKAASIFEKLKSADPKLSGLSLDIEYNRNFDKSKIAYEKCNRCKEQDCFIKVEERIPVITIPDLIIHNRESNQNNQVLIEFKKDQTIEFSPADQAKLTFFTCQSAFKHRESENYQFREAYFIDLKNDTYELTPFVDREKKEAIKRNVPSFEETLG